MENYIEQMVLHVFGMTAHMSGGSTENYIDLMDLQLYGPMENKRGT